MEETRYEPTYLVNLARIAQTNGGWVHIPPRELKVDFSQMPDDSPIESKIDAAPAA